MKKITRKFSLVLIISFIFACFSSVSNATIMITAIEDSVILDGNAGNNNSLGTLGSELNTSGTGSIWMSVLKFDLSSLSGVNINSASFQLTSFFNHSTDSFSHNVFSSSDDSWAEDSVTGLNRPIESTLSFLDSTDIDGGNQTHSWNVLTGLTGIHGLAGTNNFLTLLVRPDLSQNLSGGFGPHFNNRNNDNLFPVLIINASPVPIPSAIWLFSLGLMGLFRTRTKLK